MNFYNYEMIELGKIKPYEKNSRTHSTEQIKQIMESIKEFGFTNPLLIDKDFNLIAGHGRLEAVKQLNMVDFKSNPVQKVPCIMIDGLSEMQKKALVIADNKIALNAGWDFDILGQELLELENCNFDLNLTGFNAHELLEIFDNSKHETEINPYAKHHAGSHGNLIKKFKYAPFSILDTQTKEWQDKKQQWNEMIGDLGESRQGTLGKSTIMTASLKNGVSLLDPVMAEILVLWFGIKGGKAFDPFAGDTAFGFVSSYLGMEFEGIELRKEQADHNQARCDAYNLPAKYYNDTSENMDKYIQDNSVDLMFSCPPYLDLEVYSDNPQDLSNMSHNDFFKMFEKILANTYAKMKDDSFAVICIGEVRDRKSKNGKYVNFIGKTIDIMQRAGFEYYNEIILVNTCGALPRRAAKPFASTRKIGKRHQNVLVFLKGDARKATQKLNMLTEEEIIDASQDVELESMD